MTQKRFAAPMQARVGRFASGVSASATESVTLGAETPARCSGSIEAAETAARSLTDALSNAATQLGIACMQGTSP